jgi:hypothetical protein
MGASPGGLRTLLKSGVTVHMCSAHPDCVEDIQFRLRAGDASEMDCVTPRLEVDAFRAVFAPEALKHGDALLAVTQTNPQAPSGDEEYGGPDRPRGYTFRRTMPPFLLSEALVARVRARQPISVRFYDFLDRGQALSLSFAETVSRTVDLPGGLRAVTAARYQGDDPLEDDVLEVEPESGLVLLISRSEGDFEMRLVKIR